MRVTQIHTIQPFSLPHPCQGLEVAARTQGKHKQRVWLKISSSGLKIVDERTGVSVTKPLPDLSLAPCCVVLWQQHPRQDDGSSGKHFSLSCVTMMTPVVFQLVKKKKNLSPAWII